MIEINHRCMIDTDTYYSTDLLYRSYRLNSRVRSRLMVRTQTITTRVVFEIPIEVF